MKLFTKIFFIALLAIFGVGLKAQDSLKLPYVKGKVYHVRVTPGNPFMLELPAGERAKNVYFDDIYYKAESTPESDRIAISAKRMSTIIGSIGSIQIETEPMNLLITLRVECVGENDQVPLALEIYLDGSTFHGAAERSAIDKQVSKEMRYVNKAAEEKSKADFAAWKKQVFENIRESYSWGGDFQIDRVVDDKVQTYIYCKEATDKAVLELIDKSGKQEKINYELDNGCYVVQNKVLRSGEKFRLILGKETATVTLK